MTATLPRQRRGTTSMRYLEEPVMFRAHGHDCLALVIDPAGRVFARWFDRGRVHLAWVQHAPPAQLATGPYPSPAFPSDGA